MATLTQRVTGLARGGDAGLATVDLLFDSLLFTVLTLQVVNNWSVPVTVTVTNTGTAQSFTRTVGPNGTTLLLTPPVSWSLNSDLSLQDGWTLQANG